MYNKRSIGTIQESIAADYIKANGYNIITQNFYCRSGEIDIIANDNNYLVFIEVKFRTTTKLGYPQEAVDHRKIRSIVKTAKYYMLTHHIPENTPCRFDVVIMLGKEITLLKNAFDAF